MINYNACIKSTCACVKSKIMVRIDVKEKQKVRPDMPHMPHMRPVKGMWS